MRLNQYSRRAIIDAVMNDVPQIDYEEQQTKLLTEWAVKVMPAAVRAVWSNPELRHYIATHRFGETLKRKDGEEFYVLAGSIPAPEDLHPNLPPDLIEKLIELEIEHNVQADRLRSLRGDVRASIEGCSTTQQVVKRFPEFKGYVPTEEVVTKNLPAPTNLVTDLMKAGWPDGGKAKAEAEAVA